MRLSKENLASILRQYDIPLLSLDREEDTSHGEDDMRCHVFLNRQYVLHCACGLGAPNEERLREISVLIGHYRALGYYCPEIFRTKDGNLCVAVQQEGKTFFCYLEALSPYPAADQAENVDLNALYAQARAMLGRLAGAYTNRDLAKVYSMWSIIDQSPWDVETDEKQENALSLSGALKDSGYADLAGRLLEWSGRLRARIQRDYKRLPRCVYQGDLNKSNLLVKDGTLAGLIDFNMYGTEVNINCFLNETDAFPEEADFAGYPVDELYRRAMDAQAARMADITKYYPLNELEETLLPYYRAIIFLFQWPNAQQLEGMLKESPGRERAAALIEYVLEANPA